MPRSFDTETPPIRFLLSKSVEWLQHDSIVSALVNDPALLLLEVQSLHLCGGQAVEQCQRIDSRDAFLPS
jgi:hypothetical protein